MGNGIASNRAAHGADSGRLLRLVLVYALVPVLAGAAAGLIAARAGSRLLEAFLFEITATDPATYAAALTLVLLVALVGCLGPAVRATRTSPMAVLKNE